MEYLVTHSPICVQMERLARFPLTSSLAKKERLPWQRRCNQGGAGQKCVSDIISSRKSFIVRSQEVVPP